MRPRLFCLGILFATAALAQFDKPADNTRVFGNPSPNQTDKKLLRSVTGVVLDPDGNPAPGSVVYIKDMRTQKERSQFVTPQGTFRFDDLNKTYDYQFRAAKGKLWSQVRTLSSFDTRLKPVMNLALEVPEKAPEGDSKAAPTKPEEKKK